MKGPSIRVIAGEAKGRVLEHPGPGTRPATARVRETLFAILEPRLGDARVLDLYAGAGTLGIEALSRGAASVTFVEQAAPAVAALRRNLAATGFTDRATVVPADVRRTTAGAGGPYDLIFCDPPFAEGRSLEGVLERPGFGALLAPGGLLVYRVHRKEAPLLPQRWRTIREKVIGSELIGFVGYDASPDR